MGSAVLGLNFGTHDAAAALVIDGAVVAAAEEERFTRIKHTKAFPAEAIAFCLRHAGIDGSDINRIALFVDPRLQLLLPLTNLRHAFPLSLGSLLSDLDKFRKRRHLLDTIAQSPLLNTTTSVVPVRHHLAHAASTYLASPFDHATVVTLDGRGEYETTCIFRGTGGALRRLHSVTYPHSIGYFYSMVTRYLGFRPQRDEYKVMGLAAYGGPTYLNAMREVMGFDRRSGMIRLSLAYFDHHRRPSATRQLFARAMVTRFGPPRAPGEPVQDRHRDIAFAAQRVTESAVLSYVAMARRLTPGTPNLCLAGGVALNGVANAAIIESGLYERVYVQPASSDAGTSLGAALAVEAGAHRAPLECAFLGPSYSEEQIAQAASDIPGLSAHTVADPARTAAELLSRNMIIGWFQGRMEFGPRALGARSILAHPGHRANRERINGLVKGREQFRPLAPAVMDEHASTYFNLHAAGALVYPYMLATAMVREGMRSAIPAVVHVNATARVQTVSQAGNPLFWRLLDQFRQLTGLPIVLNTSFNGADEPIVCTPTDAIKTLVTCGLDALVIGHHVITSERA